MALLPPGVPMAERFQVPGAPAAASLDGLEQRPQACYSYVMPSPSELPSSMAWDRPSVSDFGTLPDEVLKTLRELQLMATVSYREIGRPPRGNRSDGHPDP